MAEKIGSTQLAVIGAGPGGYAAAFLAADLGLNVTLIDPGKNPGGVCLYTGCIPSKALLHAAKVMSDASEAKNWGITFTRPRINLDRVRSWKDEVVKKLTGGLGQLCKQKKINYVKGTATFANSSSLDIKSGSQESVLTFENAVIATGSYPATLPVLPNDPRRVLDSTSALELESIPHSLLVIGGGYIGLELGTVYATLGSKVTVVEMTGGLLPGVDRDLVAVLQKRLEQRFEAIYLETTVDEIKEQQNGLRTRLKGKSVDGKSHLYDKILVAVGRKPNSGGLGIENTGVEIDDRGFVKVDETRRTSDPRIFAIGDIAGEPMLAHKASHEGRIAAEVIAGHKAAFDPAVVPAVVFTDPEVTWCGLTETEARRQNIDIRVAKFPWGASGRAATLGRSDGLTKLVIDPASERILGVGIVGPGAAELIAEGVLAIEVAALVDDVRFSIHPHPTLSETIMEASDVYYGQSTHYHRPARR